MKWKGEVLETFGDIYKNMTLCTTKEEAQNFMRAYKAENQHAITNIGYLIGYASADERQRLYDLFGTEHPIFRAKV